MAQEKIVEQKLILLTHQRQAINLIWASRTIKIVIYAPDIGRKCFNADTGAQGPIIQPSPVPDLSGDPPSLQPNPNRPSIVDIDYVTPANDLDQEAVEGRSCLTADDVNLLI